MPLRHALDNGKEQAGSHASVSPQVVVEGRAGRRSVTIDTRDVASRGVGLGMMVRKCTSHTWGEVGVK
jgi:hypothetical protein